MSLVELFFARTGRLPTLDVEHDEMTDAVWVTLRDSAGAFEYALRMHADEVAELAALLDLACARARQHEHQVKQQRRLELESQEP